MKSNAQLALELAVIGAEQISPLRAQNRAAMIECAEVFLKWLNQKDSEPTQCSISTVKQESY